MWAIYINGISLLTLYYHVTYLSSHVNKQARVPNSLTSFFISLSLKIVQDNLPLD